MKLIKWLCAGYNSLFSIQFHYTLTMKNWTIYVSLRNLEENTVEMMSIWFQVKFESFIGCSSVRLLFLALAIANDNSVWIPNFRMLSTEFEINIFSPEYSGENIHFSFLQRNANFWHSWLSLSVPVRIQDPCYQAIPLLCFLLAEEVGGNKNFPSTVFGTYSWSWT